MQNLDDIRKAANAALETANDTAALAEAEIRILGRKSALSQFLRSLKDMPPEERKRAGAHANELRKDLETRVAAKRRELAKGGRVDALKNERLDVTRPGIRMPRGHLHPISLVIRDIIEIFSLMGFVVAEGPEVETEWYNFDALNIPANHPARDMWDTFWLKEPVNPKSEIPARPAGGRNPKSRNKSQRLLLRTHTSPVQVRYMESHEPPFRIIVPGRAYRYEATDASHEYQFFQLEGLAVDRRMSIANFKAVIEEFFSRLFKRDMSVRLRPSFFPFVEPGFEVDISCIICAGKGCSVCKKSGWLELAGAGMVHPNVFKAAGHVPGEWQGFAFGFGIERIAMMKYKIPDIRLFHSGDIRFLRQF